MPAFFSNVPTVNDVLVPETLLKKRKSDADAASKAAAQKVELRKASKFSILLNVREIYMYDELGLSPSYG